VRMIMPWTNKRRVGAPAALPSGDSDPTHHPAFNRKEIKDKSPVKAVSGTLFRSFRRTFGRDVFPRRAGA
jgi:hypothetical protein